MLAVGMVGEERAEALLGEAEELLVLPQRVVGVEADGSQDARARHGIRAQMLRSRVEPLEERGRKIAFGEGGDDDDDVLA